MCASYSQLMLRYSTHTHIYTENDQKLDDILFSFDKRED